MVKSHTPAGDCCLQAYVVSCSGWLLRAHVVWQKAETARPDAGPALFLLHPIGQGHHRLPGIGENGEIIGSVQSVVCVGLQTSHCLIFVLPVYFKMSIEFNEGLVSNFVFLANK